jgi:hypothetical protein
MHLLSTRLARNSLSTRLAATPLTSNRHACGLNSALASQVRLEKRAMSQLDMHLLSTRLAMLLACGSSAMSQLELHFGPDEGLATRDGIVLAQRMPHELLVEEQAAEIGMTLEPDAEHVPHLALEPVGDGPE